MKHPFTKEAKIKGWKLVAIAYRWKLSKREVSNIAASPSLKELDALAGLPDKRQGGE